MVSGLACYVGTVVFAVCREETIFVYCMTMGMFSCVECESNIIKLHTHVEWSS